MQMTTLMEFAVPIMIELARFELPQLDLLHRTQSEAPLSSHLQSLQLLVFYSPQ
jgi:hypothetical protein